MRHREAQNGDVAEDARNRYAKLGEEEIDASPFQPRLPQPASRSALEGGRQDAGEVPGRRDAAADVAA